MNKLQNLFGAVALIGVIALGWYVVTLDPLVTNVTNEGDIVGSVTSNVLPFRDVTYNDNKYHYLRQEFGPSSVSGATSTPCRFQLSDGTNATTTILSVTVQGNTATSAVTMWNIATSSTAFATTSPIVPQREVAAGQRFSFDIAMSTTSLVAASSTWLVVGANVTNDVTGTGLNPIDISGVCTALTQEL